MFLRSWLLGGCALGGCALLVASVFDVLMCHDLTTIESRVKVWRL